jgi:hypothetical protein
MPNKRTDAETAALMERLGDSNMGDPHAMPGETMMEAMYKTGQSPGPRASAEWKAHYAAYCAKRKAKG